MNRVTRVYVAFVQLHDHGRLGVFRFVGKDSTSRRPQLAGREKRKQHTNQQRLIHNAPEWHCLLPVPGSPRFAIFVMKENKHVAVKDRKKEGMHLRAKAGTTGEMKPSPGKHKGHGRKKEEKKATRNEQLKLTFKIRLNNLGISHQTPRYTDCVYMKKAKQTKNKRNRSRRTRLKPALLLRPLRLLP